MRPTRVAAASAAAALLLSGCGLAPQGSSGTGVRLLVTRDYGARTLESGRAAAPRGRETALDLLRAGASVQLARDGSVAAVDGIRPHGRDGWRYWVNGTRQTARPGSYDVALGDVVQFDLDAAPSATAIVGAYPNPFVYGSDGKRPAVHVECESDASPACRQVSARLTAAGVVPAEAELGAGGSTGTVRILVAKWPALKRLTTLTPLALGPARSGVFASFDKSGSRLALLDRAGRPVATAAPGTGLVAALTPPSNAVTWVVTGLDDGAVERAARALGTHELAGAFAVAAGPAGPQRLPLP